MMDIFWVFIFLAVLQGLLEWLPVSSKGVLIILIYQLGITQIVPGINKDAINIAVFLHIGTVLAALVYFRREWKLILNYKLAKENYRVFVEQQNAQLPPPRSNKPRPRQRQIEKAPQAPPERSPEAQQQWTYWKFLIIATVCTAIVGLPIYLAFRHTLDNYSAQGYFIMIAFGCFLVIIGIFMLITKRLHGTKTINDMTTRDIVIVGLVQGLSIVPGISRTGTTVGTMLGEGMNDNEALRASYLMSVPAVIAANIFLDLYDIYRGTISLAIIPWYAMIVGTIVAFAVGYATLGACLRLAKKVNIGYFAIIFGAIAIIISIIVALNTVPSSFLS